MISRPALMGIVNLTPDSFSGDGRMGEDALNHARAHYLAGADILDIGAESTRPGATPLSAEEEWARLEPFLKAVTEQSWRANVRLSIDTRHADNAGHALAIGVDVINDVSGFADPQMLGTLREANCDIVVMHSLTVPVDPAVCWPQNVDPVVEILRWKADIVARAVEASIAPERLIFDPGLGFGKHPEQSLALALRAGELVASGGRWLIGHSRKSFLKLFAEVAAEERDGLTLALSAALATAGVPYLRVHHVAAHRRLFDALCT